MNSVGKFLFTVALPTLGMCWAAVLAFDAAVGPSGYRALAALREEAQDLTREVDAMRARRQWMEERARLLHSRSLDPDMVDERVRAVLGYAREGDLVIPREELRSVLDVGEAGPEG